jgi:hypothetical protein
MSTAAQIESGELLKILTDVRDRFHLRNSIIIYAGSQVIYRCPPPK